jgi:hypothetical protein
MSESKRVTKAEYRDIARRYLAEHGHPCSSLDMVRWASARGELGGGRDTEARHVRRLDEALRTDFFIDDKGRRVSRHAAVQAGGGPLPSCLEKMDRKASPAEMGLILAENRQRVIAALEQLLSDMEHVMEQRPDMRGQLATMYAQARTDLERARAE